MTQATLSGTHNKTLGRPFSRRWMSSLLISMPSLSPIIHPVSWHKCGVGPGAAYIMCLLEWTMEFYSDIFSLCGAKGGVTTSFGFTESARIKNGIWIIFRIQREIMKTIYRDAPKNLRNPFFNCWYGLRSVILERDVEKLGISKVMISFHACILSAVYAGKNGNKQVSLSRFEANKIWHLFLVSIMGPWNHSRCIGTFSVES